MEVGASSDFETVFRANFPFVSRTLRRLGVLECDLADVAQELFITVHGDLSAWDRARSIKPWLAAYCLRFASNYRQLARHRGAPLDEVIGHASDARHDDRLEARQTVARMLEALDFDQRTALVLHDMEGLTAPEIAAITKVPLPTVYSRVRLAREHARHIINKIDQGGAR